VERLASDKHSSLICQFGSYEENEVFLMNTDLGSYSSLPFVWFWHLFEKLTSLEAEKWVYRKSFFAKTKEDLKLSTFQRNSLYSIQTLYTYCNYILLSTIIQTSKVLI